MAAKLCEISYLCDVCIVVTIETEFCQPLNSFYFFNQMTVVEFNLKQCSFLSEFYNHTVYVSSSKEWP